LPIVTEALHNFPEFAEIVNRIPDALSREDIQNAFIRDNYEGLIATVLWGGGHRGPFNHFEDILQVGRQAISTRIQRVKGLIYNNQIDQAFVSMKRVPLGENHINGIAESYITKVLYFVTKEKNFNGIQRPLIWDQFLQRAHCAILIDSEGVNHREYYSLHNDFLQIIQNSETLYMDFIFRMDTICREYGIVRSDLLEAFLFGERGHNNYRNPRYVTKQYIINNFNN